MIPYFEPLHAIQFTENLLEVFCMLGCFLKKCILYICGGNYVKETLYF